MGKGGSSSSKNTTVNNVDIETETNIDIDLEPLGQVLADSNKAAALTEKQAAEIEFINSELDRKQNAAFSRQIDTYLEHAKNGFVLILIGSGALYFYKKKTKKRRSKK